MRYQLAIFAWHKDHAEIYRGDIIEAESLEEAKRVAEEKYRKFDAFHEELGSKHRALYYEIHTEKDGLVYSTQ